jgi:uncharacterized RDD family membrane protein YckC
VAAAFLALWFFWPAHLNTLMEWAARNRLWDTQGMPPVVYKINLSITLGYIGYCILMEGFLGWTVGKRLFGLEVRQARQPGERATWRQVILRNVTKVLECTLYLCPLLLTVVFTRSRQRIGDMLGGTVVLQYREQAEEPDRYA